MKIVKIIIIFLASVAFVLIPLPAADINIRLHFTDPTPGNYALYYSTNSAVFSQEQCLIEGIDLENNRVTFKLDGSLEEQLTGLRLDFPAGDQLWCIEKVTVSSAGFVQKQYNPNEFFSEQNTVNRNDIVDISYATAMDKAFVLTTGQDPYLTLSETLVTEVADSFSHLHLTRLGILLFIAACYFMYKKNLFSSKE